jgi:hypothetical protein
MGALQDFERRLEGAVEGFFARTFRSGLQPVELAKAIQRYAEDTQHVTQDGVVVPNVYRVSLHPKDHERFESFGEQLPSELSEVVVTTAQERGWRLRGPVSVRLEADDAVHFGMYELTARVEVVEASPTPASPSRPATGARTASQQARPGAELRVVSGGEPRRVRLSGSRLTAGRLPSADITLTDGTVSREHAAFVLRGDAWWVMDLGSTNGTKVNGRPAGEHVLTPGDRVELGEAVLEFDEGG